jgi:hypothetical protein
MGWMTLHSISASYPDQPTDSDKAILNEYINAFGHTISCPICNTHFANVFRTYKQNIPTWADSKRDLFIAVCRIHNNVNVRLDKPRPISINEAIEWLKNATSYTNQAEFKKRYLTYLSGQYGIYQYAQSVSVTKMKKITEDYWNPREVSYDSLSFLEDDILSFKNEPVKHNLVFPKLSLRNVVFRPTI